MFSSAKERQRQAGELVPVKAEQSATRGNNKNRYGAKNAIDMDFNTWSFSIPGRDGRIWLKLTLSQVHCLHRIVWYDDGKNVLSFTCTPSGCSSSCLGGWCSSFTLTVLSSQGPLPVSLPTVTDCKYGDTVLLERNDDFSLEELALFGKQGEN